MTSRASTSNQAARRLITTRVNGGIAVTIPKLMIHAMIVAELA